MSVYLHNKPLSTCPRGHKRNENLEIISGCFQNKPLSTCPQGHKKEEKLGMYKISLCPRVLEVTREIRN